MKQSRFKKILICMVLVGLMAVFANQGVFAAINTEYSKTDPVTSTSLDDSIANSDLFDGIAKLVYAVGNLLEWILGTIFSLLTGNSDFPWADKIVFNSVPLLDVNFINPDSGSFVGQVGMRALIKNLYSTILALSVSFFGMAVMITAIKLAISTIASDKAKYKKAITDWLVGFVMVFCIHYLISFCFYLNEELVKVASKVVTANLESLENEGGVVQVQQTKLADELIRNVRSSVGGSYADILEQNPIILNVWMTRLASNDTSKGIQEALMRDLNGWGWDTKVNKIEQYKNLAFVISWAAEENISVQELTSIRNNIKVGVTATNIANQVLKEEDVKKIFGEKTNDFLKKLEIDHQFDAGFENYWEFQMRVVGTNDEWLVYETEKNASGEYVYFGVDGETRTSTNAPVVEGKYYRTQGAADRLDELGIKHKTLSSSVTTNFYWTDLLDDLIYLKSVSKTSSGTIQEGTGPMRLIADLASYFKITAYEYELGTDNKTVWKKTGSVKAENMIMYAILVGQSLILFISYIKRLFYVVILGMMAPIVVVFDFFQKFGK